MPGTALALSGGGHRATVFGLGVLLYLTDAGENRRACSVASLSGGSIANSLLAQEVDHPTTSTAELEREVVAPLAGRIARSGFIFASLALLLGAVLATLVVPWFLPIGIWAHVALAMCTLPVILGSKLLPMPPADRFRALARGQTVGPAG